MGYAVDLAELLIHKPGEAETAQWFNEVEKAAPKSKLIHRLWR